MILRQVSFGLANKFQFVNINSEHGSEKKMFVSFVSTVLRNVEDQISYVLSAHTILVPSPKQKGMGTYTAPYYY